MISLFQLAIPEQTNSVVVVNGTCVLGARLSLHQISGIAFQLTAHAMGSRISKSFDVDLTRPLPTVNSPKKIKRLLNRKKVRL